MWKTNKPISGVTHAFKRIFNVLTSFSYFIDQSTFTTSLHQKISDV